MSRRSVQWRREYWKANGNLEKILPVLAKGTGKWLAALESNKQAERSIGKTVSQPISQRKESLIRKWIAR